MQRLPSRGAVNLFSAKVRMVWDRDDGGPPMALEASFTSPCLGSRSVRSGSSSSRSVTPCHGTTPKPFGRASRL